MHCVTRIDHHIDDRRIGLARIGVDQAGVPGNRDRRLDARTGEGIQHIFDRDKAGANLEDLRFKRLAPCKGQQLPRQLRAQIGRVDDGGNEAGTPLDTQPGHFQEIG
jgi:hypothetical protein